MVFDSMVHHPPRKPHPTNRPVFPDQALLTRAQRGRLLSSHHPRGKEAHRWHVLRHDHQDPLRLHVARALRSFNNGLQA